MGSKVPMYSDMAMEFEVLICPEIPMESKVPIYLEMSMESEVPMYLDMVMDSGTSICPETHDKVEIKMII